MDSKVLRIGTRESQLAVWQATLVKNLLAQHGYASQLVYIKSEGDLDQKTPLYEMGVQGIFTRSLDIALLNNQIDIAVHSMKDVPTQLPKGIVQAAVLERASYIDLLVFKGEREEMEEALGMVNGEWSMVDSEDVSGELSVVSKDVSGELSVVREEDVSGELSVVSDEDVSSKLSVVSDEDVSNEFSVVSDEDVSNEFSVVSDQDVSNELSVVSDEDVSNELSVVSDEDVSSKLSVVSDEDVSSKLSVVSDEDVSNELSVVRDSVNNTDPFVPQTPASQATPNSRLKAPASHLTPNSRLKTPASQLTSNSSLLKIPDYQLASNYRLKTPASQLTSNSSLLNTPASRLTIATSSIRRRAQWLHRYPNHTIENLRGNVNTRLRKVEESHWHGAIFAAAGLERINLRPENSIELDWMLPAPAQGAIMVVCKVDDTYSLKACTNFNHPPTALCTQLEKDFLRELMGGCSTPISALAQIINGEVIFRGNIFSVDGMQKIEVEQRAPTNQSANLGATAASQLLQNGGQAIADSIHHERK